MPMEFTNQPEDYTQTRLYSLNANVGLAVQKSVTVIRITQERSCTSTLRDDHT